MKIKNLIILFAIIYFPLAILATIACAVTSFQFQISQPNIWTQVEIVSGWRHVALLIALSSILPLKAARIFSK